MLPGNYGVRRPTNWFYGTRLGLGARRAAFLARQAVYHAPVLATAAYGAYSASKARAKRKRHDAYDKSHGVTHKRAKPYAQRGAYNATPVLKSRNLKRKRNNTISVNSTKKMRLTNKKSLSKLPNTNMVYNKKYRRGRKRNRAAKIPAGQLAIKMSMAIDLASVATNMNFRVNMINPLRAKDGANPVSGWDSYNALFDSYKVSAIKVKYIPYLYQDPSGTTLFTPLGFTCRSNQTDAGNITTLSDILDEDHYRLLDLRKNWKIYRKVRPIRSAEITAGTSAVIQSGGWLSTADDKKPIIGSPLLMFAAQNLSSGKTYGKLIVSYYVRFKDRKA